MTGVSNEEEKIVGYENVVPVLPEKRMNELGALYSSAAAPFGAHVVRDGNLVHGTEPRLCRAARGGCHRLAESIRD